VKGRADGADASRAAGRTARARRPAPARDATNRPDELKWAMPVKPPSTASLEELCRAGRDLHARGWVPATSGNFSTRAGDEAIAITISGHDKGALTPAAIMTVSLEGRAIDPPGAKPSAETLLHCQIYRRSPTTAAVLHVHSPSATAISRLCEADGALVLTNYEMLKALAGITTHEAKVTVPIFSNTQDMASLAARVDRTMTDGPAFHGYLIAGHGLYTWGTSLGEARRHVEAFEHLFDCELRQRSAR